MEKGIRIQKVLSEQGIASRRKAEAIYERHCILCRFLEDVLGISADTAAADACRIEHIISEETFNHIKSFLNEQDTDGGQR